ncbi:hypothetical protein TPHA_0D01300 [Tetrapisispora phaffii CBS 4417]|uniref:Uncharacterized protein n=1 Tax=Tetrapisispora phaffii (strain ATCC 24235 / CBS 4417 / NBRC 1672 / NRRL Y-8282 / UCD 70-5) TaxID=1071381 RepID=G8BSF0_TETPH|nr:hypothetical protein TPHA_0D01300 [Tetrapisispora phaffii CBS 4417]CCE62771.1 hypothetical protein TPHA_0D01300 [Tetrapisispora phaffii CBS 4417]
MTSVTVDGACVMRCLIKGNEDALRTNTLAIQNILDIQFLKQHLDDISILKLLLNNTNNTKFQLILQQSTLVEDILTQIFDFTIRISKEKLCYPHLIYNRMVIEKSDFGYVNESTMPIQKELEVAYLSSMCLVEASENNPYICIAICKFINDSEVLLAGIKDLINTKLAIKFNIIFYDNQPRTWILKFLKRLLTLTLNKQQSKHIPTDAITEFLKRFEYILVKEFDHAINNYYNDISYSILVFKTIVLAHSSTLYNFDFNACNLIKLSNLLRILSNTINDESNCLEIESDTEEENLDIIFFFEALSIISELLSDKSFISNLLISKGHDEFISIFRTMQYDLLISISNLEEKEVTSKITIIRKMLPLIKNISGHESYDADKDVGMCLLNLSKNIKNPYTLTSYFIILSSILQLPSSKATENIHNIELFEYLRMTINFRDNIQLEYFNTFTQLYLSRDTIN